MSTARKHDDGQLPDGWRMVRLGDVATLQRGMDLPESDRVVGQVPVFGSNGLLGFHDSSPIGGPGVITGRSGSIGIVYYSESAFWPLNTTLYVKDFHGNDKRYVYHLLSNLHLEKFAASTSVPSLNRNFVHPHKVIVPPLREQRAIADVLDSIDEAIERTEAVIAATETLRDSLLHELLTRGVPGWHTEWKDVPGIGTIPADWEVVRLGEVAKVERGKFAHRPRNEPKFYGGDIPFIQTSDVVRSTGVIKSHSQTLNELGLSISRLFPVGTVVITIAANIGETAITAYPMAFPDSLVGITPTGVDGYFLEYFLRTQKAALQRFAPESAQKNINLEDLRPMLVPRPSTNEQAAITEQLDAVQDDVDSLRMLLGNAQALKVSVAEDLLSARAGLGMVRSANEIVMA